MYIYIFHVLAESTLTADFSDPEGIFGYQYSWNGPLETCSNSFTLFAWSIVCDFYVHSRISCIVTYSAIKYLCIHVHSTLFNLGPYNIKFLSKTAWTRPLKIPRNLYNFHFKT